MLQVRSQPEESGNTIVLLRALRVNNQRVVTESNPARPSDGSIQTLKDLKALNLVHGKRCLSLSLSLAFALSLALAHTLSLSLPPSPSPSLALPHPMMLQSH